ncbi:MAG: hypothetical protein AAGN82_22215 [Myxococcota bacterium]
MLPPLVWGAVVAAGLSVLGGRRWSYEPSTTSGTSVTPSAGVPAGPARNAGKASAANCPPGSSTLTPFGVSRGREEACVALPLASPTSPRSRPGDGARRRRLARRGPETALAARFETSTGVDQVPRLPDRPADWRRYQLPVEPLVRVYAPEDAGAGERARYGVDLAGKAGAPVTLVDLEGQIGNAEVVGVGELFGVTVVVRHRVQAATTGQAERTLLAVYGQLSRPGPNIINGATLGPLAVVGYLEDEDEATVYFEVRGSRGPRREASEGDPPPSSLRRLIDPGLTVAVDPRNVLPLRPR